MNLDKMFIPKWFHRDSNFDMWCCRGCGTHDVHEKDLCECCGYCEDCGHDRERCGGGLDVVGDTCCSCLARDRCDIKAFAEVRVIWWSIAQSLKQPDPNKYEMIGKHGMRALPTHGIRCKLCWVLIKGRHRNRHNTVCNACPMTQVYCHEMPMYTLPGIPELISDPTSCWVSPLVWQIIYMLDDTAKPHDAYKSLDMLKYKVQLMRDKIDSLYDPIRAVERRANQFHAIEDGSV